MSIEFQRPADDGGIVVEAPRPEAVTQDDNRARSRLITVARAEQTAGGGNGSQRREVVDGHHAAEDALSATIRTGAGDAHRLWEPRIGVDPIDRRCALADVEIVGIRAWTEADSAPTAADVHETGRLCDTGRGLEQERVGHGENRRIRANTNGERQHGRHRHERVAAQQPCCMHRVSSHVGDPQR
jgi:hypothetical protein